MPSNDADRIAIEREQREARERMALSKAQLLSVVQRIEAEIPVTLRYLADHGYPDIKVISLRGEKMKRPGWLRAISRNSDEYDEYGYKRKGAWQIGHRSRGEDSESAYLLSDGSVWVQNTYYSGAIIHTSVGQLVASVTADAIDGRYARYRDDYYRGDLFQWYSQWLGALLRLRGE